MVLGETHSQVGISNENIEWVMFVLERVIGQNYIIGWALVSIMHYGRKATPFRGADIGTDYR